MLNQVWNICTLNSVMSVYALCASSGVYFVVIVNGDKGVDSPVKWLYLHFLSVVSLLFVWPESYKADQVGCCVGSVSHSLLPFFWSGFGEATALQPAPPAPLPNPQLRALFILRSTFNQPRILPSSFPETAGKA